MLWNEIFEGITVFSEATAAIYRQADKRAAALQSYAEGMILSHIRLNKKTSVALDNVEPAVFSSTVFPESLC